MIWYSINLSIWCPEVPLRRSQKEILYDSHTERLDTEIPGDERRAGRERRGQRERRGERERRGRRERQLLLAHCRASDVPIADVFFTRERARLHHPIHDVLERDARELLVRCDFAIACSFAAVTGG